MSTQIQIASNLPYKVYTALLTQTDGDNPLGNCSDDPQPLIIGVTYTIELNDGTADFTNVGAPNNNIGTYFVATGITPSNWGTSGDVCLNYNTGAPVVTVLENTIGNIWFGYQDVGTYNANSDGLFPFDKTVTIMGVSGLGNIIQSTWNDEIPSNGIFIGSYSHESYVIDNLRVNNLLYNTPIEIRVYN